MHQADSAERRFEPVVPYIHVSIDDGFESARLAEPALYL